MLLSSYELPSNLAPRLIVNLLGIAADNMSSTPSSSNHLTWTDPDITFPHISLLLLGSSKLLALMNSHGIEFSHVSRVAKYKHTYVH
jgi:hypothetical protein